MRLWVCAFVCMWFCAYMRMLACGYVRMLVCAYVSMRIASLIFTIVPRQRTIQSAVFDSRLLLDCKHSTNVHTCSL